MRSGCAVLLQVFVEAGCGTCRRALELADQARIEFPTLRVEVVNLADPSAERPETVFAVPMFMLEGQVLSLGNPHPAGLMRTLAAHLHVGEG